MCLRAGTVQGAGCFEVEKRVWYGAWCVCVCVVARCGVPGVQVPCVAALHAEPQSHASAPVCSVACVDDTATSCCHTCRHFVRALVSWRTLMEYMEQHGGGQATLPTHVAGGSAGMRADLSCASSDASLGGGGCRRIGLLVAGGFDLWKCVTAASRWSMLPRR